MSKPPIRVSEAEAANDFPSLQERVRAGAEGVIERNAEAVAVRRPAAPNIRLLSDRCLDGQPDRPPALARGCIEVFWTFT
jgi:hypothetical protein